MPYSQDVATLRALATRYGEICADPRQEERRRLWRQHNSLTPTRPLIYARAFAWQEMPESQCTCEDPLLRHFEGGLRKRLFWHSLNDDSIFEPWLTLPPAHVTPPEGIWGLPLGWIAGHDPRGSKRIDPPIKDPEDAARMTVPQHRIDEEETARRIDKLSEAIGDIIEIDCGHSPLYREWNGDISTRLAQLRGLDQLMLDMMERPDWLHGVLTFMRDGILKAQEEAEQAGDWCLSAHENQAMPYAEELADPAPNTPGIRREQLWYFCASQETTLIGPAMFDEFMYQYQIPIMKRFGLVAYGCCEDLTLKIDTLRQLPNLRRIAVSPMANAAKCAEQIGADYIISYRPSPSDMVGYDFDPDRIRRILTRDLDACRGGHVDITLKDVETVQHDPTRVKRWVEITREVIDKVWT